jgi:leucyl-tRNA synthetase
MKAYDPQQIEPKWQKIWEETQIYRAIDGDQTKPKFYFLVEFPYPSGDGLHVGHVRSYTALDIMARHKRMLGFNVLYPMGWDAFGLPAENYAIKMGLAPQKVTKANINTFRRQLKSLGLSFDWSREINTTDPQYYKWTQWLFLQFFKQGLAYQAEIAINWCPKCKTGLANEEVVNGRHERCDTAVEKKLLNQWLLKITAYADRLIEDLKTVDYLDKIAVQQVNWVGRSQGAEIDFKLRQVKGQDDNKHSVKVFTTRPDTLAGATFVVVSPEVAQRWLDDGWQADAVVLRYINEALRRSELDRQDEGKDKTGVDTGIKAVNPLSNAEVPVWVADYVLGGYGTGAIMAVPAHDQRDYEFAQKFGLPIRVAVEPVTGTPQEGEQFRRSIVALVKNPRTGQILSINWGNHGGNILIGGGIDEGEDVVEAARREVLEETGYKNLRHIATSERIHHHYVAHSKAGQKRYIHAWGVLFELEDDEQDKPILEEDEAGRFTFEWLDAAKAGTVVQDQLHAYLFNKFINQQVYTGDGPLVDTGQNFDGLSGSQARQAIVEHLFKAGLARHATKYKLRDWIFSRQHYWGEPIPIIHCPKCGAVPVPESDLPVELPEVKKYEPTGTGESPLAAIRDWVEVECPKCGGAAERETDTMPNWAGSSWYYLRYLDPHNNQEFAAMDKLQYWLPVDIYNGGMEHTTLHLLYSRFWHKFLYDQGFVPTPEPYARRRSHGMILGPDNQKMSKSRGNVINPDKIVGHYGADTLRLYEMFMGPFDEVTAWSDERLAGVSRFIRRVWEQCQRLIANNEPGGEDSGSDDAFELLVDRMSHKTIKKVHEGIEAMRFNTTVAVLMEYSNFLNDNLERLTQPRFAQLAQRTVRTFVLLFASIIPHTAEQLWSELDQSESVHVQGWPQYDPELIKDDLVEIIVQVNGKLRGTITVPVEMEDSEYEQLAREQETVAKWLAEAKVAKVIVVPRKLINFVVK